MPDSSTLQDRNAIASKVGTESRKHSKTGRKYVIDGHEYWSATTILGVVNKPAIAPWMAKMEREAVIEVACDMWEELRQKSLTVIQDRTVYRTLLESRIGRQKAGDREKATAGDIGTQAHEMIDWHLRQLLGLKVGPAPKISEKALWAFMAFEDWAQKMELLPLRTEQVVYSKKYEYAGTLDLLGWIMKDGKRQLMLCDFKTAKAIYPESFCQLSCYAAALAEMQLEEPDVLMVVRLPKLDTDPEFEVKEVTNIASHFNAFLAAKALWDWQRANDKEQS